MKLSIDERMRVSEILQEKAGDRATLKLIRKAMEDLSLSDEEIKSAGYVQVPMPNGRVGMSWEKENDPMKDCIFGETVTSIIVETLKRLDNAKALNMDQASIYDKFIETPAPVAG
jgi:hypothetical protein